MKVKVLVDLHANGTITLHKSKVVIGTSNTVEIIPVQKHAYSDEDDYKGTHVDLYR